MDPIEDLDTDIVDSSLDTGDGENELSVEEMTQLDASHQIWLESAKTMYDLAMVYTLDWPSATVEWLPDEGLENDNTRKLLIGTTTTNGSQNYLMVVKMKLPQVEDSVEELQECKKLDYIVKIAHEGDVQRARYMPQDSKIVATQSYPYGMPHINCGNIFIYDTSKPTQTPVKLRGQEVQGFGLAWNPSIQGNLLSASYDGTVYLWDVNAPGSNSSGLHPQSVFKGHSDIVEDVEWHPTDENIFGSVGDDGVLVIWDKRVQQPTLTKTAHTSEANCLSFEKLSNRELVATGSSDKTIAIWDYRNLHEQLESLEAPGSGEIYQVEWASNIDRVLATGGTDYRIRLWDLNNSTILTNEEEKEGPCELLFIHGGHMDKILDLNWNPIEPWLMTSVSEDNFLQVWKMAEELCNTDSD